MFYGGVVLEIVVWVYVEVMDGLVVAVLKEVGLILDEIDGIVVMAGLGLIGGVMVVLMMVKGLLLGFGKLLIVVNYFEGYVLLLCFLEDVVFFYLLLLVFGGYM